MEIIKNRRELSERIDIFRQGGLTIGFVPTMGALHQGHLSLVEKSKKETNITVVSIFVNPTQFNDSKDLEQYPRTIETDIEKLEASETDILFLPDEKEMYPEKDERKFDFGNLDKVMEGKFREGHFNGVAQIVSKLFECVKPQKAFFGLKDFQQYVIVKALVNRYMFKTKIEIVGCPIVREANGLAMSSRNELLKPEERKNAGIIYSELQKAKQFAKRYSVSELKRKVVENINQNPFLEVEYFEIVDDVELKTIKSWRKKNRKVGCIAVFCGSVRLIDNIYFD